ncbi:adhesion G-protein coupled receptor F1-like [Dendropsophus ebraccatus]|uniref:adhesion G-protein coupled receptor F1-like n=1 Tax=Dendropsophus ebraccatus TaxID=150705 RepID=UPI003831CA17
MHLMMQFRINIGAVPVVRGIPYLAGTKKSVMPWRQPGLNVCILSPFASSRRSMLCLKVKPNIAVSPGKLFRGDTGTITCNFSEVTSVSWSHNSIKTSNNSKYVTSSTKQGSVELYELKIKDLDSFDSGTYTCSGTVNGTPQTLSTVINISEVKISASPNIDTFCDGSRLSLSCCSDDIDVFNVTWQAEDAPGEESGNSTCRTYKVSADSSRCSSPQPRTYTCNFQRNEGAKAFNVITINYITKGGLGKSATPSSKDLGLVIPNLALSGWAEGGQIQVFFFYTLLHYNPSRDLVNGPNLQQNLQGFLENITNIVKNERKNIEKSSKNIEFLINIISMVASKNVTVSKPMMENLLQTVDILLNNVTSWAAPSKQIVVLKSVESFAKNLHFNDTFSTENENLNNVQVFGKVIKRDAGYNGNFSLAGLNGSVMIENGTLLGDSTTVVTIAYSTMKDLLMQNNMTKVNALVMSMVINNSSSINTNNFTITMTFTKSNSGLVASDCVWLDLDHQYWENNGCIVLDESDEEVKCSCNHLSSFSILIKDMYPVQAIIIYISFIGLEISMGPLVFTLLIEAIVWRSVIKNKTLYMRHVCLVNIASTQLITDVLIIIDVILEEYQASKCQTVVFFSFYFYLTLFFWMFVLGLFVFYRIFFILHDMSRRVMMIIGLSLGYGCPLLIAVITVASTAPSNTFTSDLSCWLAYKPGTYLAFVVPTLTIVSINFIILIAVIIKLLRPSIREQPGHKEKQIFVVIVKSITVPMPLLGTSWAFYLISYISPVNAIYLGISLFSTSLQGCSMFIGTVLDQNVRKTLKSKISSCYWSILRTKEKEEISESAAQNNAHPVIT